MVEEWTLSELQTGANAHKLTSVLACGFEMAKSDLDRVWIGSGSARFRESLALS